MAVLIPNVRLTLRRRAHPAPRDAHGTPLPTPLGEPTAPALCGVKHRPPGGWSIRLAPGMWPVEAGDEVSDGVRTWVITGEPQLHTVPGISAVDYIAAQGTLNPPEVP